MANPSTCLTLILLVSWLLANCIPTAYTSHYTLKKYTFNKTRSTNTYGNPNPSKAVMNPIDSCWRSNPDWAKNRQALADCVIGYGSGTLGGKNGAIYVVTDPSDDPINPTPGTLRWGAIQDEPLWIIFQRDMTIVLENELMINSYKTIDGRGVSVEITKGPCLTIQGVSHVIVHGISIHDCTVGKPGMVRSTPQHVGHRLGSGGDAVTILASSYVWVDHCYLSRCYDGLVDVTHASTAVTVSNNYFTQHNKVMLLGHNDDFTADRIMKVTVAFNHFGPGCIQRMPRVRFGYAHVVNNRYEEYVMYAIGGSADPTILSQGNYFVASNNRFFKQVTKRDTPTSTNWKGWKWRSMNDMFFNGAYFVPSGWGSCNPYYAGSASFTAYPASLVPALTADAGPLKCFPGQAC